MYNILSHGHDFDPDNRFSDEVKSIFQNIQTIIGKSKYLLPKKCFDIRDKYTECFLSSRGIAFYMLLYILEKKIILKYLYIIFLTNLVLVDNM